MAPQHLPRLPTWGEERSAHGGPRRRPVPHQVHQLPDIEVGGQQVGHEIQLSVTSAPNVGIVSNHELAAAGADRDLGQPAPAQAVVVEQAVPMGAIDSARRSPMPSQSSAAARVT